MKVEEKVEVTSKGAVVGVLNIQQAEDLEEAKQLFGGESGVISLANSQYATNLKNDCRRLANTTISDRKLHELAVERVLGSVEAITELATSEDVAATKDRLIAAAKDEIKAEQEAKRVAAGAGAAAGGEAEEEG
tara:strand:- start:245 stop:646 length:402 start_codon:yes stop_codon:yes gene_type:complete